MYLLERVAMNMVLTTHTARSGGLVLGPTCPVSLLSPSFMGSLWILFCFIFSFQIFLSYTEAGSRFVFGEALVKDVFAFQVS